MRRRRSNRSQTIFNLLGLVVVVSMVLGGIVLSVVPPSRPTPTPRPTWPLPTVSPSPTSTAIALPPPTPTTTVPPTFTPTATASLTLTPTVTASPTSTPTATPLATVTPIAGLATPIPLGSRDVESFTFAVCGDSRGGEAVYQTIFRRVEEDSAVFLVSAGDLVQSGRASEFQAFASLMEDFPLPFFPVPGNHDSPDGFLDEFVQYSGAPAAHYSFDYGLEHFVVADSHLAEISTRELAWLAADLAATDQPLKMVFLHHPPFDPDGTDHIMLRGNDAFMALMQEHNVSYVFAGHIHAYAEATRDGVHYIITGGGGAPLYTQDHPQAFDHYVRVTVDGTEVNTEVVRTRYLCGSEASLLKLERALQLPGTSPKALRDIKQAIPQNSFCPIGAAGIFEEVGSNP